MDMESSRRAFDRSREVGVKKPRLAEETIVPNRNPNGRGGGVGGFLQRPTAPGAAVVPPARLRPTERDAERDAAYEPQQPHQELVSQYRTALAELTFNSKPIITNLTIIAGENLHAAKAIAATVCSNILEVPSEQKLPSLYLLDSIVKNIGRDYIKFFAAKLPEVFCKAYRQVESSIHSAMRHLFGTWKGVFPQQTLQMIEKELGFSPPVNGSGSVANASRPDTQSQRPAHSIHVNPKYLEARQRLQQSSRAKSMTSELPASVADATEDVERPDRTGGITKTWTDLPVKMPSIRRAQSGAEPVQEKTLGTAYGDYRYGSDLSRASGLGIGKGNERATDLGYGKGRYGALSGAVEPVSGQTNGFDIKHKFTSHLTQRSENADLHLQTTHSIASRSSGGMTRSWKNSEEEEFMWDDMNPRLKSHAASSSLRKDLWSPDESEKMDFESHPQNSQKNELLSKVDIDASVDSLSTEQKDQALYGHRISLPWSKMDRQSTDGLSPQDSGTMISGQSESNPLALSGFSANTSSSLALVGQQPHLGPSYTGVSSFGFATNALPGPSGTIGQQWPNSRGSASPSGQSPMHHRPPSPSYTGRHPPQLYRSSADRDPRADFKAAQMSGQLKMGFHNQVVQDSVTNTPQNKPGNFQSMQPPGLQTFSSSLPLQLRHQIPCTHQMHAEPSQPELSLLNQKSQLPHISNLRSQTTLGNASPEYTNSPPRDLTGQSNPSSLLAAVLKSGILSDTPVTGSLSKLGTQDSGPLATQSAPLPTGPPATQFAFAGPKVSSTAILGTHPLDKSSNLFQRKTERPPLPLGPPPTSSNSDSSKIPFSNMASSTANPITDILSSLVAKGLITASKSEQPGSVSPPMSNQSQNPVITTSSSVASTNVAPTVKDEVLILDSDAKSSDTLPESTTVEVENLIGFDFKADIIRESHPSVVSALFDDLPHQCSICGLRLRLKDRLDRHLNWHASKKPDTHGLCRASRTWFLNLADWVSGGLSSDLRLADPVDRATEMNEQMVPADESQCICILCGELFEDFYHQERDEWMFKDAVHMTGPPEYDEMRITDTAALGPIVHLNCISDNSACDLGHANGILVEKNR